MPGWGMAIVTALSWQPVTTPAGWKPEGTSPEDTITGLACAGAVSDDRMQNATPINTRTILIIPYSPDFF
jgi:hypothetical protein